MSFMKNVSISTKNGLFGVAFSFVFTIAVLYAIHGILTPYLYKRAQEDINANAVLARAIVELKYGKAYELKNGNLYIGSHNLDDDEKLIDEVTDLLGSRGDVMTIFKGDVRVRTNVRNPQTGGRAIGTRLAPGPAYDMVFRNKKTYQGEAVILGQPYLSSYDPILDKTGNVIGIFFVGLNKSAERDLIARLEIVIGSVIVLISACMAAGAWTLSHYQLRPLADMEAIAERLRRGDTEVEVPSLNRGDEIGKMAHAIQTMKEYVLDNKRLQAERTQAIDAYTSRAEEIILLQESKQKEMESNARRAEQLIDMQAVRVSELAQKEKRAKILFEFNTEFDKSVRTSIDSLLVAQNALNATAEAMTHNVVEAAHIVNSSGASIKNVLTGVKSIADATEEISTAAGDISRQISQFSKLATNVVAALNAFPFASVLKVTGPVNDMASIAISLVDRVDEQKNATAKISNNAGGIAREAEIIFNGISSAEKMVDMAKSSSKNVLDAANCLGSQSHELDRTVKEYLRKINSI